ncbi:hypothetical protein [Sphaerotilus microaerophilus]|uniref:helix-hairpin-helix domain-containing protein n=1 Tax=Sphaerotilus microaerophilus TaxID=2914710 RepID=UPI0020745749|nr:hypothetical protein [Sphaerotilus sp. FB-5]
MQDKKRHGVEVWRVDVIHSDWNCTLDGLPEPSPLRLGLRMIGGLKVEAGLRIFSARRRGVLEQPETVHGGMFVSLEDESDNVQVMVWLENQGATAPAIAAGAALGCQGHMAARGR